MASIFNFASKKLINRIILTRHKQIFLRNLTSGSKANQENSVVTPDKSRLQDIPDFSKPLENKNWVSYGFDYESEKEDRFQAHTLFFTFFSFFFIFATVFFTYAPDPEHKNWAKREAFIRLHERERLGLEPIDYNYIDPSKVHLPSDEELGDMEIII